MSPSSSFIQQTAKRYAADAMLFLSQDPESLSKFHKWLQDQKLAPDDMMSDKEMASILKDIGTHYKNQVTP